jgi:hypothetical protein
MTTKFIRDPNSWQEPPVPERNVGSVPQCPHRRSNPEAQIQRAMFRHLRARGAAGIFAWHPFSGGYRRPIEAAIYKGLGARAGLPDVMVLHNGKLFGLELKAEGGKPTPKQVETIAAMQMAGAIAGVAIGLNDALRWLEERGLLRGQAT